MPTEDQKTEAKIPSVPALSVAAGSASVAQLTALWYETIGGLHHKDRDCHFRISAHWKYSGEQTFDVEHAGYLLPEVDKSFTTCADAEEYLVHLLVHGIRSWIDCEDSSLTNERRAEILASLPNVLGQTDTGVARPVPRTGRDT